MQKYPSNGEKRCKLMAARLLSHMAKVVGACFRGWNVSRAAVPELSCCHEEVPECCSFCSLGTQRSLCNSRHWCRCNHGQLGSSAAQLVFYTWYFNYVRFLTLSLMAETRGTSTRCFIGLHNLTRCDSCIVFLDKAKRKDISCWKRSGTEWLWHPLDSHFNSQSHFWLDWKHLCMLCVANQQKWC